MRVIGYPKPTQTPKVIHYTNSGSWFENWQPVDYADLWLAEKALDEASLLPPQA